MNSNKKYYLKNLNDIYEKNKQRLNILLTERHRAEDKIQFITKTYMYVFGFLFIYTGFVVKMFLLDTNFEINEPNFIKYSASILGLFLILVITTFGRYGTIGISHMIKRRFEYTYEINKIINNQNRLLGLDLEHFLKIPVIYTWTTTIIIAGSIFYFILMFGINNGYYITGILTTILLSLNAFPKTNKQFFHRLNDSLIDIYNSENKIYKSSGYYDKSNLINSKWLYIIKKVIIGLAVLIESLFYFTDEITLVFRITSYIVLIIILILIEYIDIKRSTNRKCIFDKLKIPYKNVWDYGKSNPSGSISYSNNKWNPIKAEIIKPTAGFPFLILITNGRSINATIIILDTKSIAYNPLFLFLRYFYNIGLYIIVKLLIF